ncbi:MAG: KdsC family phosphatase [Bacteroidota bacterium]|jgi:YrbI family 3-deoxy-D-manno-octulosonate 8-phosphate phosphatase
MSFLTQLPKLIITDIDGVWTDGGMYYDKFDNEFKKFNTSDGAGLIFCRMLGIEVAIITGENTPIVTRRAEKLKINHVFLGIQNKLYVAKELCQTLNISLSEVAYIGDDIGDISLLREVGFSGAPSNAMEYVKKEVNWVGEKMGGDGAFREFVEYIISRHHSLDDLVNQYVQSTLDL